MPWQVAAGVLYALSFPPFNLSYLCWIALVPLLYKPQPKPLTALASGILTGFTANLIIFFWLWKTFHAAHVSIPVTFFCWMALAGVLSLYFGAFTLSLFYIKESAWKPLLAAATWVGLEYIRTYALTGFPWALVAHTQVSNPPLIQIASLTGAWGISFLIIGFNALVAAAARSWPDRRKVLRTLSPALTAVLACYLFGLARLSSAARPLAEAPSVTVALLQGNIDQYQKWNDAYEADIRLHYGELAQIAGTHRPDLIIWPESSVPGWIPNETEYVTWVSTVARASGAPNLIGAVSSMQGKDFNSAFLIQPNGTLGDQYSKRHLVPFGEEIPFGGFMKKWVLYLGQLGVFDAGEDDVIFPLESGKFAVNICYEAIFPNLVRHSVRDGAQWLINITNDGWFLDTAAPAQHFAPNVFRAVENKRAVARAANTGISALIDPYGRILLHSQLLERGAYVGEIPIISESDQTIYTRWGDWFAWGALLTWIVTLVLYTRRHVA